MGTSYYSLQPPWAEIQTAVDESGTTVLTLRGTRGERCVLSGLADREMHEQLMSFVRNSPIGNVRSGELRDGSTNRIPRWHHVVDEYGRIATAGAAADWLGGDGGVSESPFRSFAGDGSRRRAARKADDDRTAYADGFAAGAALAKSVAEAGGACLAERQHVVVARKTDVKFHEFAARYPEVRICGALAEAEAAQAEDGGSSRFVMRRVEVSSATPVYELLDGGAAESADRLHLVVSARVAGDAAKRLAEDLTAKANALWAGNLWTATVHDIGKAGGFQERDADESVTAMLTAPPRERELRNILDLHLTARKRQAGGERRP